MVEGTTAQRAGIYARLHYRKVCVALVISAYTCDYVFTSVKERVDRNIFKRAAMDVGRQPLAPHTKPKRLAIILNPHRCPIVLVPFYIAFDCILYFFLLLIII